MRTEVLSTVSLFLVVLLLASVDRTHAQRFCLGNRATCHDNLRRVMVGRGCSAVRRGFKCRPFGRNDCRCLPAYNVIASVVDLEQERENAEAAIDAEDAELTNRR